MGQRTTVGIVGAGPAGLTLGNALLGAGVDCVILESRSRDYVEQRARAGVIEDRAVGILDRLGLAHGAHARDVRHDSCEFRYGGQRFSVPYGQLAGGATHYIYPQQELVTDLVAAFLGAGGDLRFDTPVVQVRDVDGDQPRLVTGAGDEIGCDFVAGADGFYGATRAALPDGMDLVHQYPYRWLAVLGQAPPSTDEIIYGVHEDGFAGHMLRSSTVSRFYLQCHPGETTDDWPAERIWQQLRHRLAVDDDWKLTEGPIIDANVLDMRTYVRASMSHNRVFLLGDAAHVITPAGAKGMNLAIADADELAGGLAARVHNRSQAIGDEDRLAGYSERRLTGVWQAQQFSDWLLHLVDTAPEGPNSGFEHALRVARLEELRAGGQLAKWFAENYVGLDSA